MKHRFTVSEKESEVQFHRVSQDLLTHNPKQGVKYWGGAEYHTMLIWAGRIYDFVRVLESIVGHYPARMQSYTVGYTSGWNGADVGARLLTDAPANDGKTQLLSSGSGILSGAGWGRCEIEYDDATGQGDWIFPEGNGIGHAAREGRRPDKPACPLRAGSGAGGRARSLATKIERLQAKLASRGDA